VVAARVKRRTRLWIALSLGLLVLSVIAVCVRVAGYPEYVPRAIASALDYFIEPGAVVWWMTMGKVFQGFPSNLAGYIVVSVGNTAVWTTAGHSSASLDADFRRHKRISRCKA
jgi:hypothetical protein